REHDGDGGARKGHGDRRDANARLHAPAHPRARARRELRDRSLRRPARHSSVRRPRALSEEGAPAVADVRAGRDLPHLSRRHLARIRARRRNRPLLGNRSGAACRPTLDRRRTQTGGLMKYFPLVFKNLLRKKTRSLLTVGSILLPLFVICIMGTLLST